MSKFIVPAAVLLLVCELVAGHGRWKCPPPRDANDENGNHITFDNTGNKYAACGPESGKWGFGTVTNLKPGWTTLSWEESVSHKGSPFRLAILDETETARVVLLDHIPHNDDSAPSSSDESTYYLYQVSVNIPDIQCDKCSLQFLYVMTDKSVKCGIETCYYNASDAACKGSTDPDAATCTGAPNSNVCTQENECFSNCKFIFQFISRILIDYLCIVDHSCSDITISGTTPIDKFAFDSQPEDWPFKSKTVSYYGAEVGTWANGWLSGLPANFTTTFDSLTC